MKMLLLVREIITCLSNDIRLDSKHAQLRSTFLFSILNIYFVAEIKKTTIVF